MFIDARAIAENEVIDTDVCIIGAGPAGITLAHEFIGQPFRVCLFESGGLQTDEATQSLAQGENIGLSYLPLDKTRLRNFGGTLAGTAWCAPLDQMDFEEREWIPYSGWPLDKSRLDPFYERAQSLLALEPLSENIPSLPFTADRVITKFIRVSSSISFGELQRDLVKRADNIRTYLYANAVEIETTETARTVTRLRVACLQGNNFWVSAKLFILAAGGIENARLLLLSNKVQAAGLGNQNDFVGRFFMEHPHLPSGIFVPLTSTLARDRYNFVFRINHSEVVRALALPEQTMRREKLANVSATLEPITPAGAASITLLLRAIRRGKIPDQMASHLSNVIYNLEDAAAAVYNNLFNRQDNDVESFCFYNRLEQTPNPDSRVTLSAERDSLGMNRIKLDWRLSEIDLVSFKRANEILAAEINRARAGTVKFATEEGAAWPRSLTGGHHHMGTTRMHVDPKKGVVDQDCRVHGISNLFVAGSSVFSTSGCANPTLTIVALAVKLADHVKSLLKEARF